MIHVKCRKVNVFCLAKPPLVKCKDDKVGGVKTRVIPTCCGSFAPQSPCSCWVCWERGAVLVADPSAQGAPAEQTMGRGPGSRQDGNTQNPGPQHVQQCFLTRLLSGDGVLIESFGLISWDFKIARVAPPPPPPPCSCGQDQQGSGAHGGLR